MSQYNPYSIQDPTTNLEQALLGVTKGSGQINPVQYFGRYNFSTPQAAANFIQTPQFTGLWDKNNVGLQNIGIRAELNDSGRYNDPMIRGSYADEVSRANASRIKSIERGIDPDVVQKNLDRSNVSSRASGRFYTQQGIPNSVKDTSFYLNNQNATSRSEPQPYPIRVLADKRLSRFSISEMQPWNGAYESGITVDEGLGRNQSRNLTRVVGKDLGASLSSNPKTEAFVSSQMASNESRYAGRVNEDGTVTLMGSPKTSVALQRVGNALQGAGTFMNYAGLIPIATSELRRAKADYENPVTQEVYKKEDVQEVDGQKYATADLDTIARYHPDNADLHPEITDAMRKKFYPKWFEK